MEIYRNNTLLYRVDIDESTVFTNQLMGEHRINAEWISFAPIDIRIGDRIVWQGESYFINLIPEIEKINNVTFRYNATFEGYVYNLYNKIFMDEGSADFSYFGTITEYLSLLVENMNAIDSGWSFDYQDEGDTIPLSMDFKEESCRVVLGRICEEFKKEFRLSGKTIIVKTNVGFLTTQTFMYGRAKGLYSLTRTNVEEKTVVTRLYVYGGEKNLGADYRNGTKRLVFDVSGKRYLEANQDIYGIREGSVTFDHIFPERTGTITDTPELTKVTDSSMNFDLNQYLLEGETAKIVFKTGDLAGIELDISKYDHATKTFTFIPRVDENDYTLPNDVSKPSTGDQYTLLDIKLPQSYIDAAEAKLLAAGQEYHEKAKSPYVSYQLDIDEKYMRDSGMELGVGNTITVLDELLGVDEKIRVYSVSYPLVNPQKITAGISDEIPYTVGERLMKETVAQKIELQKIDKRRYEDFRLGAQRMRMLQGSVFDPDGYFNGENIKPESIETYMLSVGAKSQNFGLNGVEIEPNYQGNPNALRISSGQLVHWEIEIEGLGYIWQIDPLLITTLVSGNSYYVYAKVSRSALTGTWFVSTQRYLTEQEAGVYYFSVGILFKEQNGVRFFEFTKGMTFIVGDTITTGTIKSLDGLNFFNLTMGTFKLGNSEQGIDWGVTSEGQLTINGALVSKMIFAEDAEIINLVVKSLRTNLSGKRIEILESENNLKFYDTDGNLVLQIDDDIDSALDEQSGMFSPRAGIRTTAGVSMTSYVTANGLFSNASGYSFLSALFGIDTNASIVGILNRRNTDVNGISAGVVGIDNTSSGNSKSYGGYFNSLFAGSIHVQPQRVTGNYTINRSDTFISCYNNAPITIDLPENPYNGRMVMIRKNNDFTVMLNGNGQVIVNDETEMTSTELLGHSYLAVLLFDGQRWFINSIPRQ